MMSGDIDLTVIGQVTEFHPAFPATAELLHQKDFRDGLLKRRKRIPRSISPAP